MADSNDEQMQDTEAQTTDATSAGTDLAAQVQAAREEAASYKDKFLRERAEMENFRKRQERLANDRNAHYKREMLHGVLEVADNLDRAMLYRDTMDREALQQTLRMVQWQLGQLLEKEGLTAVPAVGEQFNPHVHEAIDHVASAEHPEGTVIEEVRKGYMLGNEMLRPARVRVSAGSNS
jgi:molecular chaperone GrpE